MEYNGRTLIRKTSFASRSIRRRQRSSFADLTCKQLRPMDEGLGRKHVCRSAQNGLGDCKPCGSKSLCRSLGTISSSRCQTTRDMQTLRGEALNTSANFISYGRATSSDADGIAAGGARRDRTDDLLLAKQALSQLSYGPVPGHPRGATCRWWAWDDSNVRPHPYQGCALTT